MLLSIRVETELAEERTRTTALLLLSRDARTEVGFLTTYCDTYV